MSGRAQDDYPSKMDSYMKESRKSSVGKFMRTFSRSKTSQVITAWDSIYHFIGGGNYWYPLADVTGAVDSATTVSSQIEGLLDATWELYYKNANLKDLEAAEEASWKLYFGAMFFIKSALQITHTYMCYLPAYTEADDVPGALTTGNIFFPEQQSYDTFVASMSEFPVPALIDHIVDLFCGWVIQLSKEYERYTLRIPPMIFYPWVLPYDLEDLEAARGLLRVNWGNAITHAQKFGLKMGSWKDPVKPVIKMPSDLDVFAFFNHAHFKFYDNQPAQVEVYPDGAFMGTDHTSDYTNTEYFFMDTPNESPIHVLAPFFGTYNAVNNPYGGLILEMDANTTEYRVNFHACAQHGTSFTVTSLTSAGVEALLLFFKGYWDGNSAAFQVQLNGTDFTAEQAVVGHWPLAHALSAYIGGGRPGNETDNDILNYIGRLL